MISDDEHAYLFMAQIFASGRVSFPAPPVPPRLPRQPVHRDTTGRCTGSTSRDIPSRSRSGNRLTRRLGSYGIGDAHGAAGLRHRAPPLRPAVALLALPLLLVSPYFLFPSATLLAHSTVAVLLLAFLYAVLRLRETPRAIRWWLLAGAALGWATLTRPFSAPIFAAPWLCSRSSWTRGAAAAAHRGAGAAALPVIGAGAFCLLLAYQYSLSGSPFESGYQTFSRIRNVSLVGVTGPRRPPAPVHPRIRDTRSPVSTSGSSAGPLARACRPSYRVPGALGSSPSAPVCSSSTPASRPAASSGRPRPLRRARRAAGLLVRERFPALTELGRRPILPSGAPAPWPRSPSPPRSAPCTFYRSTVAPCGPARIWPCALRAPGDECRRRTAPSSSSIASRAPCPPYSWAYYRRNNLPDLSDRVLLVNFLGRGSEPRVHAALPDRLPYEMGMEGAPVEARPP